MKTSEDNVEMTIWTYCRGMSFLRFLFGGLLLPFTIPWLLYRIIVSGHNSRQHAKVKDKVVLITGASSGLGEALAHEFYKAGCKVILAARKVEELNRVRDELLSIPRKNAPCSHLPVVLQLDLAELNDIPNKVKEALQHHNRIDILVNNGGISYRGHAEATSIEVDIKVMVVNYFGQIALTKATLPSMIANGGGQIVAVGSIQGKIAIPYRSSYAASKHALQAFFDILRSEMYHKNIKVTVISPGYLKTKLSVNAIKSDGSQYGIMDQNTATGMDPSDAAGRAFQAIVLQEQDVLLAGIVPSLAVYLRTLLPTAYFSLMRHRAAKQLEQDMQQEQKPTDR